MDKKSLPLPDGRISGNRQAVDIVPVRGRSGQDAESYKGLERELSVSSLSEMAITANIAASAGAWGEKIPVQKIQSQSWWQ